MSYSQEFREFVVGKIHGGMSRSSAMDFFNISRDSVYKWMKKHKETGSVLDIKRKQYKTRKISSQRLLEEIETRSDATLQELAEHFSCTHVAVWRRLKNLKITRKKNHTLCREKRRKKAAVFGGNSDAKSEQSGVRR